MADRSYLDWPFFEARHRRLAADLERWVVANLGGTHGGDAHAECRRHVAALGRSGWLRYCVPAAHGGAHDAIESRSLCLARETLARHDGLADFSFAMQGLGSGAITLAGSDSLKARWLPKVASGEAIAAFALSEPEAGSDVAAMTTRARRDGDDWVIDGVKTWISNGGIADFYCLFARTDDQGGAKGISAFVVSPEDPGFAVAKRIETMAPHPLATLELRACRVGAERLLGAEGEGFKLAMRTLDIFRASVAAAALGFARRALDEAIAHATRRRLFGRTLADFQMTQAAIADMATGIDAAALLTYRAAWARDSGGTPATREAAMAKMTATETAQAVIDRALQMFGGAGVVTGNPVERLYREIRALRIYEGATEVQKLVIARETLRDAGGSR
jgi:acyl-CoA dehydrogenase